VVLIRQLTGHVWLAAAGGLIFAMLPLVWNIGTHADPHALHIVMVGLLLALLVGWEHRVRAGSAGAVRAWASGRMLAEPGDPWLVAAAIVFGLSLANHTLTLLLVPGIGLYVLSVRPSLLRRKRLIAGLALAIAVTAVLFYLELPIRAGLFRAPLVYGHPERLDGLLYVVLAQQFVGALYQPFTDLGDKLATLARLAFEQFGPIALLVPIGFLATVRREPRYALLTGLSFLATVWFAASYVNADISRYYLGPALMAITWVAILAAVGVEFLWAALGAEVMERPRGVMMSPLRIAWFGTPNAAALVLEIAVAAALLVPSIVALPARAASADLSHETAAADWANAAMRTFEPNAVVITWWSYSTTLWYAQIVEGQRPDVWIVDDRTRLDENLGDIVTLIESQLDKRPVYLVRLDGDEELTASAAGYNLETIAMPTDQSMFHVLGRRAP
jgi:hypothetical protein